MENLKLLKKIKDNRLHFISADGGTLYQRGELCLEGNLQCYFSFARDESVYLLLSFLYKELGVDDTHDLQITKLPSNTLVINTLPFKLSFEKNEKRIKHLSLFHFHEERVGKVYENNILFTFEDGSSLLVQPQGYLPFINLYSDEQSIINELKEGIETKVF